MSRDNNLRMDVELTIQKGMDSRVEPHHTNTGWKIVFRRYVKED